MTFIAIEETPRFSGLDVINAAALWAMSPFVLVLGFGLTAAMVYLARWLGRRLNMKRRWAFFFLMLVIVPLFSFAAWLDRDWLMLAAIEVASMPAAFLLAPRPAPDPSR